FDKVKEAVQGAFRTIVENIPIALNKIRDLFDTVKNSTAFQTLKEVIGDVIEIGKELIQQFLESDAWAGFKDLAKDIAQAILDIDFGEVIRQVGEFIDTWSPLIAGIMGAIGAFKLIMGAMTAFNTVMGIVSRVITIASGVIAFLTSPIGLVVAAIGIIIGIGVLLWKNWETISEKAREIWGSIVDWFAGIPDRIGESLGALDKKVATSLSDMGRSIESNLTDSDNVVLQKVGSIVGNITDNFDHAYSETGNIFSAIKETISMSMGDADLAVATSMSDIGRTIESKLTESDNVVLNKMGSIVGSITDNFDHAYSETGNIFEAIKMTISMTFQNMAEVVKTKASEIWNSITEWFGGLPTWFSNTWNSI